MSETPLTKVYIYCDIDGMEWFFYKMWYKTNKPIFTKNDNNTKFLLIIYSDDKIRAEVSIYKHNVVENLKNVLANYVNFE